jgi:mono/diheme cytochrome c family protein
MGAVTRRRETPPECANLRNPLEGDPAAVAEGEALYVEMCVACHGETGRGDGPAAQSLDPAPADFSDAAMTANMTDGYMYWRITEGGQMEPFHSAMPAFGDELTEDERWQLIAYLRTLDDGG